MDGQTRIDSAFRGNARTRATRKYQEKVGLISKSYKLHRDAVEAFAEACETKEISQSAQLEQYMRYFAKRTENGH